MQGEKETGGILGANSFWVQANRLIETAFAAGTGAVVLHVQNAVISGGGIQPSPNAVIKLNYISAEMIIPISVDNGKITEAAFASEVTEKGKKLLKLETHLLDGSRNYVIKYYRFKADDGVLEPAELPQDTVSEINTGYHGLNLHAVFTKGTVEFRLFNSTTHAGKLKAYIQFCLAVNNQALIQRSASPRITVSGNERYTFRTWLLRLGLIGDEFKTARKHLLANLDGDIAWRYSA